MLPLPSIQDAFEAFHVANPNVYAELVRLARQWKERGKNKLGIGMLWEVMRWNLRMAIASSDEFTLNNNHRSRYARKIMANEADLADIFEVRELKA